MYNGKNFNQLQIQYKSILGGETFGNYTDHKMACESFNAKLLTVETPQDAQFAAR